MPHRAAQVRTRGALAPPLPLPTRPVASGLGRVEESKIDRQHDDQHSDGSQKENPELFQRPLRPLLAAERNDARRTEGNANDVAGSDIMSWTFQMVARPACAGGGA